jgi:hypothetical protein
MLLLAQAVLALGAFFMIPASWKLFSRALDLGLPSWSLFIIIPLALAAGVGKAVFVMRKRMRQNIARLRAATGRLWPWQIYPPQLLAFILSMVFSMFIMKRLVADSAVGLGVLGGVDVAVAAALFTAIFEYRR